MLFLRSWFRGRAGPARYGSAGPDEPAPRLAPAGAPGPAAGLDQAVKLGLGLGVQSFGAGGQALGVGLGRLGQPASQAVEFLVRLAQQRGAPWGQAQRRGAPVGGRLWPGPAGPA